MKCKGFLPQSGAWLQGLTTVWLLPSFIVTPHSVPTCHPKSLLCAFVPAVQRPKASPFSPFIHTTLTHNFSLNCFALAHFLPGSFSNLPAYLSSSYGHLLFALPALLSAPWCFIFEDLPMPQRKQPEHDVWSWSGLPGKEVGIELRAVRQTRFSLWNRWLIQGMLQGPGMTGASYPYNNFWSSSRRNRLCF